MKKMVSAALLFCMVLVPVFALAEDYTIEDAYAQCCVLFPDMMENIKAGGVSDEQIITFLKDIQTILAAQNDEITEDNFGEYFYDAVNEAIGYRRNLAVEHAIVAAYPDAATQFEEGGSIPEEFKPLYEVMKNLIFVHGLIGTAEKRAAVCFVGDTKACFFVSEGARAVAAIYDAEGILCKAESCEIEEDKVYEFDAAEGEKVKLMALSGALEPLCEAAEKNF